MNQTPDQPSAKVRETAEAIRANADSPYAFAIGCIKAGVDSKHVSDAEFRTRVRTVLAALDLATSLAPVVPPTPPRIDTEEAAQAAFALGHLEEA